jgi:hypothetical protein
MTDPSPYPLPPMSAEEDNDERRARWGISPRLLTPSEFWERQAAHAAKEAFVDAVTCTGISAGWCPIHGTCTCVDRNMDDADDCPLHGLTSNHAVDLVEDREIEISSGPIRCTRCSEAIMGSGVGLWGSLVEAVTRHMRSCT